MRVGRRISSVFAGLGLLVIAGAPAFAAAEGPLVVADGRRVSVVYTLKLDDGSVVDSNVAGELLEYTQGGQTLLPALQRALAGLLPGARREVTLSPAQAYGPVNPQAYQRVPLAEIPEESRRVGARLFTLDEAGQRVPCRVQALREDEVLLNYNHPLAGQTLHYSIRIVDVRTLGAAKAAEKKKTATTDEHG